ncbi:MAG TPA: M3 family metallopeptidase [Verrucomicrobiae bacterium]|nr:M3 family metallopeptidase [Verrucomicrobiae bacterium]
MRITPFLPAVACAALLAGCGTSSETPQKPAAAAPPAPTSLVDFQKLAAAHHAIISVPNFEASTNAIAAAVKSTIHDAESALDAIGKLTPAAANFQNTAVALDDVNWLVGETANRLEIIKETSQDAALREASTDQLKVLQEWSVGLDYREDVYRALKAFADSQPKLAGEDAKLLAETMRDYRRAGLALPKNERDEVEDLRKKLSSMTTDFDTHVTDAHEKLTFTKEELAGVPEDFLEQKGVNNSNGTYSVMANITWHYITIEENAQREETRLKFQTARDNLARAENVPLLEQILVTRDTIAHKLGYKTWADYVIEVKMAKTAATATDFLQRLTAGLQPKFDAEIAEFRALKVKETGDTNAQIHLWDWRYFANQLKKQKYTVDEEQLRVYFPYQRVLEGMFSIYQRIFGLKFYRLDPPAKWVDDLQLYAVADSATGEPLGLFYLDMFPREGKYNHFAQFDIIAGKALPDGGYQRPTVALICNFPSPAPNKPSLLDHRDVETLFHEFGHAMHSIMTRAKYSRFSGTSVPRDFVEAPSQMLENWVWDKKVLDSFAADYRDPSKKIPTEILGKLKEAKLAIEGTFYRRQLSFGLVDLALHSQIHATNAEDTVPLSNKIEGDVFFPEPPDTAFVAYFGHLMGYDAGYYGYAWADAIAADMATVFEKAPDGYFDIGAGRRLRKEIYEVGDSRDVQESIEKFLGRKQSINPFLKKIGIESAGAGGTH